MDLSMFVSNFIGDGFKSWHEKGHTIFIQTPTQSGKTTFFFDFLQWFMEDCKKSARICFLVPRKALLKKVEEDLRRFAAQHYFDAIEIFKCVNISTYQHLEHCLMKGFEWHGAFDYIFCDEAHYFLSDSSFNPNTFVSYRWLLNTGGVKVFMSATLENTKNCIIKDVGLKKFDPTQKVHTNREYLEYTLYADYSQYEISYFIDEKTIPKIIGLHPKEKWGIFLTNKAKGEKIRKELNSLGYSVSFLDAEFANDRSAKIEMENIVMNERFDRQILIATPVLDTGINLFDKALKNIIVMANTPESFVQMLGRKRRLTKDEKIRLFIPCRSVNYFDVLARTMCENRIKPMEEILKSDSSADELLVDSFSSVTFDVIQNSCFVDNRNFVPNPLSITQFFYEYGEIVNNLNGMRQDKFYFVKKQLSWLGFDETDFSEENLVEHKICRNVRDDVLKILEKNAGKVFKKEEFAKILENCAKLISQVHPKIVKSGRAFTFGKLNEFCQNEEIPFVIKSKGGNRTSESNKSFTTYEIKRLEVD